MAETKKGNEIQKITQNGSINFASDVIAVIAGLATSEVKGIAGMSGIAISEFLGRKNLTKGVKVNVTDDTVSLEVNVVVNYGVKLQDVALEVQKNVCKAIETMTGLEVSSVAVNIQNIVFEKEQLPVITDDDED